MSNLAFIVKYLDKDDQIRKEIKFHIRSSADERLGLLLEEGHTDVELDTSSERNGVSLSLMILGILLVALGIIYGMLLGMSVSPFHIEAAVLWMALGLTAGMLLIGLGEAVHLLDRIHNKLNRAEKRR
ncbi:hypothetical protein [Paenibacillus puerhi]|uniref:hypothetical protein n=1 Tax=Paenibacillus puerhi TaxID=2692622 RepID=UPI001358EFC4|nr:hypothetical protein [Paenibacillus puerhi]